MGLMHPDYKKIDRDIARNRIKKQEREIVNRKQDNPIGIYCLPIIMSQDTLIRCIFCGHPVLETRNQVLYVSAFPLSSVQRAVYDTLHCKRCGQRYTKLV